jgi:hypothetical protein
MTISFARYKFPPAIIQHAVWLYVRFTLSYRDVEDLLAERGLDVSYETVQRRLLMSGARKPGPGEGQTGGDFAANVARYRPVPEWRRLPKGTAKSIAV